ncbi:MAG: 50S ribosomal protein L6 [Alphaproteobacteria bacterium]|nr:50S ribosomal protein L6 [Alphaproteobacteria bacterium]
MSRIGNKPVTLPEGVEFSVNGQEVKAKGKLGELTLQINDEVSIKLDDVANDEGKTEKVITLEPKSNSRFAKQIWPTMRTLVDNIVIGVSEGFSKKLEIKGVGYRGNLQGKTLVLALGFSHEVRYDVPEGVELKMLDAAGKPSQTDIEITGIDKQLVGQVAAKIRGFKKPEPYKGKGIRYVDEYVVRKEGKKK